MGAIDLVVQIESPPSVTSDRVLGVHVGATPTILPKYRSNVFGMCCAVEGDVRRGSEDRSAILKMAGCLRAAHCQRWLMKHGMSTSSIARFVRSVTADPSIACSTVLRDVILPDEFAIVRPGVTWDRIANNYDSVKVRRL